MDRPTCSTCIFWAMRTKALKREGNGHDYGDCRRFPPTVIRANAEWDHAPIYYPFPNLLSDSWCGEHPDFPAYIAERKAKQ